NQRITDIENRLATSQTDDSASTQEIKETLVFLSDQLSRLDKSVQTQRPRSISRGVTAFKPGGFNDNSSYNEALAHYKAKRYDEAISGFTELLTVASTSQLADNAQYWIGECYDATGKYTQAIEAFNKVFDYPKSNKLPDAHVKIGLIYAKMKNNAQAREELQAVIDNYPGTNAASVAASKIKTLGD
ncbi:tol-pal system protein YbgF, partial [Candidatus Latescibacterota bacterium]